MEEIYDAEFYEEGLEESGFDIKTYYRLILKKKWIIITTFCVVTAATAVFLFFWSPNLVYKSTVILRVDGRIDESRFAVINSRSFAEAVVSEMGLNLRLQSPGLRREEIFSEFKSSYTAVAGDYTLQLLDDKRYQLLFNGSSLLTSGLIDNLVLKGIEIQGISFKIQLSVRASGIRQIGFSVKPFQDAVGELRNNITFYPIKENLLVLSLQGEDPDLLTRTVNALAEMFVVQNLELIKQQKKRRRKILEEELSLAKAQQELAERGLVEFKSKSKLLGPISQLDAISSSLAGAEVQVGRLIAERRAVEKILGEIERTARGNLSRDELIAKYRELIANPSLGQDVVINVEGKKLIELADKKTDLAMKFQEKHPEISQLNSQIVQVQERIKQAVYNRLKVMNDNIAVLSRNIKENEATINRLPDEEQELASLQRRAQVSTELYKNLLIDYQQAEIAEKVEVGDMHILDKAIRPRKPENEHPKIMVLFGGMVFGIILGLSIVFGVNLMDNSIKSVEDVKKHLKLPTIGTIPRSYFPNFETSNQLDRTRKVDRTLVTYDYSLTHVAEAYRSLRTNIIFSKSFKDSQSIVFTSVAPSDGKSFTASNLAVTMAQHKTRTLLVDADLRRGVLHNTFACRKEPGLTNFLMGRASFGNIINPTHVPNLFLVSCGALIPNPSELLGSQRMRSFLQETERRFQVIIFDTPPLNAATDAIVLGSLVDAMALVVRSELTNFKEAKETLDLFNNVPARIIGVVLNAVDTYEDKEHYSYYHY